jgi:hypothetical protein
MSCCELPETNLRRLGTRLRASLWRGLGMTENFENSLSYGSKKNRRTRPHANNSPDLKRSAELCLGLSASL